MKQKTREGICEICSTKYDINALLRIQGDLWWVSHICSVECYTKYLTRESKNKLSKILKRPQRQDSLETQLNDLLWVAERLGMYDASDFVKQCRVKNKP